MLYLNCNNVKKEGSKIMKKALKFFAYPLVAVLAVAVNFLLFYISTVGAVSFMLTVSLVFYMFLGGIVLNKINDKKIRNSSLIFTSIVVFIAAVVVFALHVFQGNDTIEWISILVFPFSVFLRIIFVNFYSDVIYCIFLAVGALLPVLISYLASLVFGLEKKKLKYILIALMALCCAGSAVGGAVNIARIAKDSVYKDGDFYNAYYDINGNKYASNEEVPYYDREGNVYYQTYNHPVEDYSDEWFSYVGEITDENGNEYDISDFYVYADGYIFMDNDDTVELRDDIDEFTLTDWAYVDSEGNICGQLIGVSYTSEGEPYFGMGDEYKNK